MDKLFVYGIFLGDKNRHSFDMTNPRYDVALDYSTYHLAASIVEARPCKGAALTGLVVDVPPYNWRDLDELEYGYNRKIITTVGGEKAYIYVGKGRNEI